MKKLITTCAFLMLITGIYAQTTFTVGGIAYSTTSANTVAVASKTPLYTGSITIPSSVVYSAVTYNVTSIGDYAFNGCTGLTSIIIPNSVSSIGGGAFYNCSGLASITIPNSVSSIGGGAFDGTAWFNNQSDGLVYAGKCAYSYKGTMPQNTSIIIPNTVTSISEYAFYNCTGLTSITIPNSVTSIGNSILYGCTNLVTIEAPADCFNMQYPNNATTGYTSILQSIKINSDTLKQGGLDFFIKYSYRTLKELDLKDTQNTELLSDMLYNNYSLQSLILPKNLKTVSYHSLSDCFSLTSINIPASVTSIEMRAFENGRSIKKVTFETGSQLKTIGNWAFYSCHALDTISIPVGVTSIGDGAFWGCDYLKNVTIPSSVKSIGDTGFEGCIAMKIMHVAAIVPPLLQTNTFNEVDKSIPVVVPVGSLAAYKAATGWKDFINLSTTDPNELNQLQETSYNIYAKGRSIVVDNASNLNIRIFDLSGRKVAETIQASQNETINMPATGVYLVRIGSKNTKVMVN